jgi:hypothetical protein
VVVRGAACTGKWVEYGADDEVAGYEAEDTGADAIVFMGQETVYYPAEINNVFYLNDAGEYAFVPCSFLATTKHIRAKIAEIQEYLPEWQNMIEIVMVLQICGYHVPSACRYAKHNGLGTEGGAATAMAAVSEDRVMSLEAELVSIPHVRLHRVGVPTQAWT